MDVTFYYSAVAFYFIATFGYLAYLIWMAKPLAAASWVVLLVGLLFHTATILARYMEAGHTPVTNRFEALVFFSWTLVVIYVLFQVRRPLPVVGAFVTPPALLLLLIAAFHSKQILPLDRLLDSRWLPVHVWFAFLGDALFGVAACSAGMYLIQEKQLKSKKIGPFYYRLPSIDVLSRMMYRCVSIGFPLLTLGILSGSVWLKAVDGGYIDWQDGRQTSTLLIWFLYAAILHGRLIVGWRGRRVAWMNVIGFLVILVTFLNLSHFIE